MTPAWKPVNVPPRFVTAVMFPTLIVLAPVADPPARAPAAPAPATTTAAVSAAVAFHVGMRENSVCMVLHFSAPGASEGHNTRQVTELSNCHLVDS